MKAVRFKPEYSDSNPRLSYELEDEKFWYGLSDNFGYISYYNTKLLGLVPAYKMEEADENDVPAVDVFVKLSNI